MSDEKERLQAAREHSDWREEFVAKLNAKTQNTGVCSQCGHANTSVAPDIVTPIIFQRGGLSIGGNSYPQAMVVCANCGHTRYFNLVALGVKVP